MDHPNPFAKHVSASSGVLWVASASTATASFHAAPLPIDATFSRTASSSAVSTTPPPAEAVLAACVSKRLTGRRWHQDPGRPRHRGAKASPRVRSAWRPRGTAAKNGVVENAAAVDDDAAAAAASIATPPAAAAAAAAASGSRAARDGSGGRGRGGERRGQRQGGGWSSEEDLHGLRRLAAPERQLPLLHLRAQALRARRAS
mmetsp:Transcript_46465/g.124184  ORF Transcript_46465/g.124184 Transcript_46465/m.124184 type:complete len:202 (+) Transcript_46465:1711-2316(+)